MNITAELQRTRDLHEVEEKLRQVNSMLSFYAGENKRNAVAVEAYELLRLQTMEELADLGAITHESIS